MRLSNENPLQHHPREPIIYNLLENNVDFFFLKLSLSQVLSDI